MTSCATRNANMATTRYKVLRVLYRWLGGRGAPQPDSAHEAADHPRAVRPNRPADGFRRLLAACAGRSFEARRDTAIIMLLLDTGARRAELAISSWRMSTSTWTCCWCSARAAARRPTVRL
jgi:integrase